MSMGHTAQEVLKDIIARHGRSLLKDRRRCEGCIRDAALSEREINGLMGALKAGIPARISEPGSTGLTPAALSTYASQLAEESGLDQELARWSVDCWAHALGVGIRGEPGADQRQQDAPEPREQGGQRAAPDQPREQSAEPEQVSPSANDRGGRVLMNIITSIFFIILLSVGVFIFALVYFAVVYGGFAWLSASGAVNPNRLGEQAAAAAGAYAFPAGSFLFVEFFWDRLVRKNGEADYVARAIAGVLAAILSAASLFAFLVPAFYAANAYKAPGIFLTLAFGGLVGWIVKTLKGTKT
jgi:hypothetical protein